MPFVVPEEEIAGVVPGKQNWFGDWEAGPVAVLKVLVWVLSWKAIRFSQTPAMYRVFCQKAPVEKIPLPNANVWTTLLVFSLNWPMLSRFTTNTSPLKLDPLPPPT